MICPSLVTTPRRSPSPSKARPSSASPERTRSITSARFSGLLGSGWWFGKSPSTSEYSSWTVQPSARRIAGAEAPAMPLPQSTAVADDARGVLGVDRHRRAAAAAGCVVVAFHAPTQALDVVAVDGAAGEHHLEAVVVLRVVAARHLD